MAAAQTGKFDSAQGWRAGYPQVEVVNDLVTTHTSVNWVKDPNTWSILTIYVYAQFRMFTLAANVVSNALAYVICEILSFDVPGVLVLAAQAADNRVVEDVRKNFPLVNAGRTQQQMQNLVAALPQGLQGNLTQASDFSLPAANAGTTVVDIHDAWACCWIVARCKYDNSAIAHVVTIYVSFLATIAKMGNVSDAFLDKISNRVLLEINVNLVQTMWDAEVIERVWILIGEFVTETNMGAMCDHWTGANGLAGVIPQHALYMRILVSQIKGEGLTALSTIKKALQACPTFPWGEVAAMFPAEFAALQVAFNDVGQNAYYGYKKQNATTKSTLYKNVAWVAKELLIRMGGNGSLSRFKGWTRSPERVDQLNTLITNFINNLPHPTAAAIQVGDQTVQTINAVATAATGVTIN